MFQLLVGIVGFGGLSVSLEGPSKSEIQCKDNKDGTCKILYKPTEPGIYVLSVKFADHHVPGTHLFFILRSMPVGNSQSFIICQVADNWPQN